MVYPMMCRKQQHTHIYMLLIHSINPFTNKCPNLKVSIFKQTHTQKLEKVSPHFPYHNHIIEWCASSVESQIEKNRFSSTISISWLKVLLAHFIYPVQYPKTQLNGVSIMLCFQWNFFQVQFILNINAAKCWKFQVAIRWYCSTQTDNNNQLFSNLKCATKYKHSFLIDLHTHTIATFSVNDVRNRMEQCNQWILSAVNQCVGYCCSFFCLQCFIYSMTEIKYFVNKIVAIVLPVDNPLWCWIKIHN